MLRALTILSLLLATPIVQSLPAADTPQPRYAQRWFYLQTNLLVEKNVDEAVALIARAGKAGYNGVVLADYKFNILERMPPNYFKNVERVKKAAADGRHRDHSDRLPHRLQRRTACTTMPNLAEGMPVEDAPFVVKDGVAVLVHDPAVQLVNGDLEDVKGDRFAGFSFQDEPGKATFADRNGCPSRQGVLPHGGSRQGQRLGQLPARAAGQGSAARLLSLLLLGEDAGPEAGQRVQAARPRQGRPASDVLRGQPEADAGLDADRGCLQQPR